MSEAIFGHSPLAVISVGGASQLLVGTTVIAAFFAGVVALFAPCCVSVMLPAYLATGVHRRRGLVAMTFVFAAGVGAVILPIAFGATELSRLISGEHTIVYSVMAVAMVAMGVAMAAGFRLPIPMLGVRARQGGSGPGSVFVLGAFSGVATACCAPVLAGVIALSGAAASFLTTLGVGVAYVFGMVAPLFVIALVWDGREIGASRWLTGRSVRLRLVGHARAVPLSSFAGGLLLVVMGVVVGVLAVTGPDMATRGWQAAMSGDAQHYAHVVIAWLGHLPGWVTTLGVFAALGALVILAVRQVADRADEEPATDALAQDSAASSCADDEVADGFDLPAEIEAGFEADPDLVGKRGL
ncbi:MAG: cytochrome c biogenesis protein CcdA [Actinomycetota bacterium]|nr:cytochrome c biogenesis protein CcdA [Actinomycetota bacterium]